MTVLLINVVLVLLYIILIVIPDKYTGIYLSILAVIVALGVIGLGLTILIW